LTHTEETVQGSRALVAVQPPHVREAQRKVAIRTQRVPVDNGGLGTVHGLQAENLLLRLHEEHVLPVVVPVSRLLPELFVDQDRRGDLLIVAGVLILANEALQLAHDRPAAGQPDGRSRRDLAEYIEVELAPELPVVALLGFFETPEILLEILLREPRRSV